jgi:hypothetical protein
LSRKCVKYIKKGVGVESACELFGAKVGLLEEEEGGLLGYIEDNAAEIFKTKGFTTLSKENMTMIVKSNRLACEEIDVFKGMIAWAEAQLKAQKKDKNSDNLKELLSDVLPFIRFPLMSMDSFAANVPGSGLLAKEHLLALFTYFSENEKKQKQSTQPEKKMPWNWSGFFLFCFFFFLIVVSIFHSLS